MLERKQILFFGSHSGDPDTPTLFENFIVLIGMKEVRDTPSLCKRVLRCTDALIVDFCGGDGANSHRIRTLPLTITRLRLYGKKLAKILIPIYRGEG
jgi:hypothetical protein